MWGGGGVAGPQPMSIKLGDLNPYLACGYGDTDLGIYHLFSFRRPFFLHLPADAGVVFRSFKN
jgi:hypothetical protein